MEPSETPVTGTNLLRLARSRWAIVACGAIAVLGFFAAVASGSGQCVWIVHDGGIALPVTFPYTPTSTLGLRGARLFVEIFRGLGMPLSLVGFAALTTAVWAHTLRSPALLLVISCVSVGAAGIAIASLSGAISVDARGILERDFFGVPWLQKTLTLATLALLAVGVLVWAFRAALTRFAKRRGQVSTS